MKQIGLFHQIIVGHIYGAAHHFKVRSKIYIYQVRSRRVINRWRTTLKRFNGFPFLHNWALLQPKLLTRVYRHRGSPLINTCWY